MKNKENNSMQYKKTKKSSPVEEWEFAFLPTHKPKKQPSSKEGKWEILVKLPQDTDE